MAFADSSATTFVTRGRDEDALSVNYTFPSEDAKIQAITYLAGEVEEEMPQECNTVVELECRESGTNERFCICLCPYEYFLSVR